MGIIRIRVFRSCDNVFLEEFSIGAYMNNHEAINRRVKDISRIHGCDVYFKS